MVHFRHRVPWVISRQKGFSRFTKRNGCEAGASLLLRRLKSDVLKELPDKIESVQACELLPEQKSYM